MLSLSIVLSTFVGCRRSTSGTGQSGSGNETPKPQLVETSSPVAVDKGDLKLRYEARKQVNALTASHTVGTNPQAIEKLISELNQRLILPFDIYVVFKDCELPDAFYDPETHEVTLCYQLIDDYYDLFAKKIKDKTKLDDAVKAATVATFFHELGHSLVDAWKIPITGREEDAVDQLSTLVLIEATEGGEQMALDGALAFKLYADAYKGEKVYWDEHSLDEQRFFDTICLVYGHDEKKYAYLVSNGTLPEERASYCSEDYDKVNRAWRQLLAPYLTVSAQPRPKLKWAKSLINVKFSNKKRKSFRGPLAEHTVLVSQQAVYRIVEQLKKRIALPFELQVSFEQCGVPDSYYDYKSHEIVICYELIETYHYLFSRTLKVRTAQNEATKGATVAMFLHEVAHALIDGWDLPITGREEDAADQFSTLLLINDIPDGNKMALDSARVFKLLADLEKRQKKDYSDAHSLDEQRFFNTVCLVYGNRPVQYEYLVRNGILPAERAFDCEEEYARVNRSWQTLLAPHLAYSSYQLKARSRWSQTKSGRPNNSLEPAASH